MNNITLNRVDSSTVPARIIIKYADVDRDDQIGTQSSFRVQDGFGPETVIELPIRFESDTAKQIAEVLLKSAHKEANGASFGLPLKYLRLEPSDVITIKDAQFEYKVRITSISFDGIKLTIESVFEDSIYTSQAVADKGEFPEQELQIQGPSRAVILDIPALRHGDDDTPSVYVGAYGLLSQWKGATLYFSESGTTFEALITTSVPVKAGNCITNLPAFPSWGATLIDTTNTVDVVMTSGELESYPLEDIIMDNTKNACAIERHAVGNPDIVYTEVLQFANATLIAPKTYRLSMLIRHQAGTEQAPPGFSTSIDEYLCSAFVLLDEQTIRKVPVPLVEQRVGIAAANIGVSPTESDVVTKNTWLASVRPARPVSCAIAIDMSLPIPDRKVSFTALTRASACTGIDTLQMGEEIFVALGQAFGEDVVVPLDRVLTVQDLMNLGIQADPPYAYAKFYSVKNGVKSQEVIVYFPVGWQT